MTVRAKFQVQSIAQSKGWGDHAVIYTVRLSPVIGNSDENKAFYASTPSGSIELGIVPESVGGMFAIGQEFYVDFTPA